VCVFVVLLCVSCRCPLVCNKNLNLNKQTFFKSIYKGMFLKIKNINIVKAQEKCRKEHLTMIIYVKKFIKKKI